MNKKPMPLATLHSLKKKIDPTPDYQRPPAWSRKQKQLLIDSILRDYDIPKMYWKRVERDDGVQYEVIDGQQRLRTIWEFRDGEYPLAKDADDVGGAPTAGLRYDQLDVDLTVQYDSYPVDVVIVEDALETEEVDETRDMFLRLQNGTTLKAQEKRNAKPGLMRDFVRELSGHTFFEKCKFSNTRYTYDHVAAQMARLGLAGEPASVRDSDLNRLYDENRQFDRQGDDARHIRRVLAFLDKSFPEYAEELERYNAITLFCLASTLIDKYVLDEVPEALNEWFIEFETNRRANMKLEEDEQDPQLVEYRRLTSYSTDGEESIRGRLEFAERSFFLANPDILLKDDLRVFAPEQRLAIYRRDKGLCQVKIACNGTKCKWDDWHADHKLAHSKGGPTTVANGQVACVPCNLRKSAA